MWIPSLRQIMRCSADDCRLYWSGVVSIPDGGVELKYLRWYSESLAWV